MINGVGTMQSYELTMASTHYVLTQSLAVLYPEVIDPARLSEIKPEDLELVETLAADAQKSIDESKKPKKPSIFSRASSWVNSHPTLKRSMYVAGISALCLAALLSAVYLPFSQNAKAHEFKEQQAKYGFNEFSAEARAAASDSYINNTELVSLRAGSERVFNNLTGLNETLNGQFADSLNQLASEGKWATELSAGTSSFNSAYSLFDNVNKTLAEIDNASLEARLMLANLSAPNSAIAKLYADMQANISVFKRIYNATLDGYKIEYGPEVYLNFLKSLEEPSATILENRKALTSEIGATDYTLGLTREFIWQDLTQLGEDLKFKSIDGQKFALSANALTASIDYLEKDLNTVGDIRAEEKDDNDKWFLLITPITNTIFWTIYWATKD